MVARKCGNGLKRGVRYCGGGRPGLLAVIGYRAGFGSRERSCFVPSLPPAPVQLGYASVKGGVFASTRRLSRAVQILLVTNMLIGFLGIVSYYWQLELLQAFQAKVAVTPAQANANDVRLTAIAGLGVMLMLGTAIVFLMWVYRATANLRCFSSRPLEFTPGGAVGWFFFPVMNLIRVPQVIRQIYNRSSDPERPDKSTPAVVGWWWACWILAGLIHRAANAMVYRGAPLDELVSATWTAIVGEIIFLIAALCAITIVRRVEQMQENRPISYEDAASPPPLPAPTPVALPAESAG